VPPSPLRSLRLRLGPLIRRPSRRWQDSRLIHSRNAFLRELGSQLSVHAHAKVAVIDSLPRALAAVIADAYPHTQVVSVDSGQSESALHASMAAHGPYQVVVVADHTGTAKGRVRRFRNVFLHVVPGGVLILSRIEPESRGEEDVRQFVASITTPSPGDAVRARRRRDYARIAEAIGRVDVKRHMVLITNKLSALAKMREDEMNTVLGQRSGASGKILERRPPLELESRCQLRASPSTSAPRLPPTYHVPDMWLREYYDVVCAPGQVAVQGNLLLPDTYRHNQRRRLTNHRTREISARFATLADGLAEPRPVTGAYFYLDSEWPGHFGHAMTEVMSRLWAWEQAKQLEPNIKALLSLRPGATSISEFHLGIFRSHGIDAADVLLIDSPVRVEKLLGATPMFSMPSYVHPDIRETWARVGASLAALAPAGVRPGRVFCSRRQSKRRCRNSDQVESLFASHGFQLIHPEDFHVSEQAAIFRGADIVAGYAGSGLFSLALCDVPKRVIMISSETYVAQNEYMISSVLGHQLDIAWCQPDAPKEANGWAVPGFNSDYAVDFNREGLFLEEVLRSL
jgi:capsular polysaccharide biosynthesis protein